MMGKAALISIKPRWCELIAEGKKTLEVRRTRPRMLAPFKVYIYETRGNERFGNASYNSVKIGNGRGKVIGEFICDWCDVYKRNSADISELALQSLVQPANLYVYMGEKNYLYGWHITELKIYDQPKELGNFKRWNRTEENVPCAHTKWLFEPCDTCKECNLKRAPQSWCYVEEREN